MLPNAASSRCGRPRVGTTTVTLGVPASDGPGRPLGVPDMRTSTPLCRGDRSQPENPRHALDKVVLAHRGVDLDRGQVQARRLRREAIGEHPVAFEQVALGAFRVAGLVWDVPRRTAALERGPPEL